MYFQDLSDYSYYQPKPFEGVLNIGWLDKNHPYSKGTASPEFIDKLFQVMKPSNEFSAHANRMRGIHPCNLCGADSFVDIDPKGSLNIGASEIWIPRPHGGLYAAPSMLIHYVIRHQYLPPKEFVDAVLAIDMKRPLNAQVEYKKRAAAIMT